MSPPTDTPTFGCWGERVLEDGDEAELAFGPLTIHLARTAGELRLATEREDAPDAELDWSRWATAGWDGTLRLRPAFPDRPLVVAPEDPFHLLAGAEARIYVRVPLWVTVEAGGKKKASKITTVPSIPASDTWWGTVEEGEIGYWLTTHARRAVTDDLFEPHLAMCPLELVNRSSDDLTVDKIALRVDYLTLYADGERIWSDETRVRYQGDAEGSRLEMAGRPPAEAPGARLFAEPRLHMARGFRAKTFARLRGLPGWMA